LNYALKVEQIAVSLDQTQVLKNINLDLKQGEIMGLLGPSGCGKTTLLNTIAGFIQQEQGKIIINNSIEVSANSQLSPEERQVGMIFQDYALFPHLTVRENIAFGLHRLDAKEKASKVFKILSLLKLEQLADRYPHELSGGQQQRVAIARAIAPEPKLLLLDEPFSNIDARLRNDLILELRTLLKKLGMSAIFVTHNKDEVFTFADKMAIIDEGNILQSGTPAEICQQPTSWQVADFLQLGTIIPAVLTDNGELTTNFGTLPATTLSAKPQQEYYLLLKPQHLVIATDGEANANVAALTMSEHGYKLTLTTLTPPLLEVHVFHQHKLALNSKVCLRLLEHQPIVLKNQA
jgi:iron(III) transport system ATP-binding protein